MVDQRALADVSFDPSDEYRPEPSAPENPTPWKDGSVRVGIHTSIAGNVSNALDIAHSIGANALQIFSCSPRMWARGPSRISEPDAQRFRARRKELGLGPLVIHCNYLINLGSPEPVLRVRSIQAFQQELVRAIALGADYLVLHPGNGRDSGREAGILAIAGGLRQALRGLTLGHLQILLENTAGQGSSIGVRFEELQAIIAECRGLPLGVCIDTAHLFAAGWDIRTADGLEKTLQDIDATVGLASVAVIHVNDSKTAHGSRVDRHEHIGRGKIGADAFRTILNHPLLKTRPFILETPIDKPGDDRKNVAMLWKLLGMERKVAASDSDESKSEKKPRTRKPTQSSKKSSARKPARKRVSR